MTIEIKVPALGESVTEATVGQWFKKPGDAVRVDEPLVELETDKVTVEVPAPAAGVLADIKVEPGATVGIGSVLGSIAEGAGAAAAARQALRPRRPRQRLPGPLRLRPRLPRRPQRRRPPATAACRPRPPRAGSWRSRASPKRRCRAPAGAGRSSRRMPWQPPPGPLQRLRLRAAARP